MAGPFKMKGMSFGNSPMKHKIKAAEHFFYAGSPAYEHNKDAGNPSHYREENKKYHDKKKTKTKTKTTESVEKKEVPQ